MGYSVRWYHATSERSPAAASPTIILIPSTNVWFPRRDTRGCVGYGALVRDLLRATVRVAAFRLTVEPHRRRNSERKLTGTFITYWSSDRMTQFVRGTQTSETVRGESPEPGGRVPKSIQGLERRIWSNKESFLYKASSRNTDVNMLSLEPPVQLYWIQK